MKEKEYSVESRTTVSTTIKNLTHNRVLITQENGTVIFLNAFGTITYPDLDILGDPVNGLIDVFKTDQSTDPDAYPGPGEPAQIKNASKTLQMCVCGTGGDDIPFVRYLLPGGAVDISTTTSISDLQLFSGKHSFSISKRSLDALSGTDVTAMVPLVAFRAPHVEDVLTVYTLARSKEHDFPAEKGSLFFEITSNDVFLLPPGEHDVTVACQTLPHVALCTTTKVSVIILTMSVLVFIIILCIFIGICVMQKGKNK